MYNLIVFLCCVVYGLNYANADGFTRGALVVTLAGNHKLSPYFEWTCRTIGYSKDMFDMLVFHESNTALKSLTCASNVKFFDLGERALSKVIVNEILTDSNITADTRNELYTVVSDIIVHSPRYLVEVKPMTGSMFAKELQSYSHWSYTDPDIVWGNLGDWVDKKDLEDFDIVTMAKNVDAARLFIRGQFAMHKNLPAINTLWKGLEYFSYINFAKRVGNAYRMLLEKKTTDEIFANNFNSAEGWYSQLVFKNKLSVKIVSRGFDDFFREPVILNKGRLTRCPLQTKLSECIHNVTTEAPSDVINIGRFVTVHNLPEMQLIDATAHYDAKHCKMAWLPPDTRYCLAQSVYDKDVALVQDKQTQLKLLRVGEAMYRDGKWKVNDESVSRRQYKDTAAIFHFRHWDDFLRKSFSTEWGPVTDDPVGCMVVYLRVDGALSFESCDIIVNKEKDGNILLEHVKHKGNGKGQGSRGGITEDASKLLAEHRRHDEVGGRPHTGQKPHHNLRGAKPKPNPRGKPKPRPGDEGSEGSGGGEEGERPHRGNRNEQGRHKPALRNRGEGRGEEGEGERRPKHKPKPRPQD